MYIRICREKRYLQPTGTLNNFSYKISYNTDNIKDVFLEFDEKDLMGISGYNLIKDFTIIADNRIVYKMSGKLSYVIKILSNTCIFNNLIYIPLNIDIASIPYTEIKINISKKQPKDISFVYYKTLEPELYKLLKLPSELSNIVIDYLINPNDPESNMEISYKNTIFMGENLKRLRNRESKFELMESYKEKSVRIKKENAYVDVNIEETGVAKQLIFWFSNRDGLDTNILPILKNGKLLFANQLYQEFDVNHVHKIDKIVNNKHVPNQHVYTLTFQDLNSFNSEFISTINLGRIDKTLLKIEIEPQKYDVMLNICWVILSSSIYVNCKYGIVNL